MGLSQPVFGLAFLSWSFWGPGAEDVSDVSTTICSRWSLKYFALEVSGSPLIPGIVSAAAYKGLSTRSTATDEPQEPRDRGDGEDREEELQVA